MTVHFIAAIACLFIRPVSAPAGSDRISCFVSRSTIIGGEASRYQVFVPEGISDTTHLPVILYLHGAGGMGTDGVRQTATGLGAALRANPGRIRALVVFPQARVRWVVPAMEALAMAALAAAIAEFHGDTTRIYLMGYSVGAAGAWRLAYRYPAKFAAVVAVAGSVQSSPALFTPEELRADQQTHRYLGDPDPFASLAQMIRGLPIAIYHDAADSVVSPLQSRKIAEALVAEGSFPRCVTLPGVGHQEILSHALADDSLWIWLFRQRTMTTVR